MPELPEVETVRRGLLKKVQGRKIIDCKIIYKGIIEYPNPELFIKQISNQEIIDIKRKGKILIYELNDYYLTSHLRMEGKYFIKEQNSPYSIHDHVIFKLDNNKELRYNDTRKFGKMNLVKKDELYLTPVSKLGKEPWDESLTHEYLKEKFNRNIAIKTLLLDQSIIAGIGNIYADEILFMSKINPTIKGYKLTNNDHINIINNTRNILKKAIDLGGTTIHTYASVDGITGRFQQELLVHNKENNKCPYCDSLIVKITVNGRGTYYCPKCQK